MSLLCPRGALLLTALTIAAPAMAEAVEVKGARFAANLEIDGRRYERIGYGLFRYLMWDAYAGAYYQARGFPRPAPQSDVPRRLVLEYFHAIEAEEFAKATRKSLRKAFDDNAAYTKLSEPLATFNERYRDVIPGDRYALGWDDDRLTLALNGETLFEGDDLALANALFGIWLGEDPLDEDFRDDLLGR
ncbi:chalcone isomerase family protein [Halomonas ventosae]|uniref:Chalcone isomerase-like protein n=1 Tax=Halomonas ventosae TaxID=229007 RepID=A0A4R6HFU1_9GAMM|nr:chalcone isomerase family protein [Halomonas ventosae]TDO06725.1 chalcone isomerase-like protein [Halomonas ventosae]